MMSDLETKLCKLAAWEQELGDLCKGHLAIVEKEPQYFNMKVCDAYDWFGVRQFRCKYSSKNMSEVYCLYNGKR